MVLVPLLVTFLIGFQLTVAAHSRNVWRISLQDQVSQRAISGEFAKTDEVLEVKNGSDNDPLKLLVSRRKESLPNYLPGFFLGEHGRTVSIGGLAVIEAKR